MFHRIFGLSAYTIAVFSAFPFLSCDSPFLSVQCASANGFSTSTGVEFPSSITVQVSFPSKQSRVSAHAAVRSAAIREIMDLGIPAEFERTPYGRTGSGNAAFALGEDELSVTETKIWGYDGLDMAIRSAGYPTWTGTWLVDIPVTPEDLKGIFLFRNPGDLSELWYSVVSSRSRTSHDEAYRAFNISTAFRSSGNVVVMNPGDEYSYLRESGAEAWDGRFRSGVAIVGGRHVSVYAGGICGGSTAIYQGIAGNSWLEITERRPHSEWYGNLYVAKIGNSIARNPGMDAMVYNGQTDFRFRNVSDRPIVVVMDFAGRSGEEERVYTLSLPSDDGGSPEYVGRNKSCYTWKIQGKNVVSCYGKVK